MKETTIHFQGQDYQVKYKDEKSYYLNGLVITPFKANDHSWMSMLGLNESRYVIYSPDDTGGTGINIFLCAPLGTNVHVMIFAKGNQSLIFEQLGTTDEDDCFSIIYPDRLQEGDILVTRFTDTGWTPKFAILKGIVTEYGGVLCHAAIVSREYGIPAIVSATNIMKEIKDGETITINGTTGIIRKER